MINFYGGIVQIWTEELPKMIDDISRKYGLSKLKPFSNLSYNFCAEGFQDNLKIVLKITTNADEIKREFLALKAFEGPETIKVLAQEENFMILECAIPGESLETLFPEHDDESINIMCGMIQKLHKTPIPKKHSFPHIKDWLQALDKDWNIPENHLQKAKVLKNHLLETSKRDILLHGDLHHGNILKHENAWVMIDPKGVIGDPVYEFGAFIRNPIKDIFKYDDVRSLIKNRIHQFAKTLDVEEERVFQWYFVQTVLSWIWALEDGCDHNYFQQLTKTMPDSLQ